MKITEQLPTYNDNLPIDQRDIDELDEIQEDTTSMEEKLEELN
jgi:hypothetical protein